MVVNSLLNILEYHRQRTKPKDIAYSLYLYFLDGLSYRKILQKHYIDLSIEAIMSPSGSGCREIQATRKSIKQKKKKD